MILVKTEEQSEKICYLDLSRIEAFGLDRRDDNFVIWALVGSNRFYLCGVDSLVNAKTKLEKVVDYAVLLNTSQPSVIGHYDSIDDLIHYCENRFSN